jgi:hypothetical protein
MSSPRRNGSQAASSDQITPLDAQPRGVQRNLPRARPIDKVVGRWIAPVAAERVLRLEGRLTRRRFLANGGSWAT